MTRNNYFDVRRHLLTLPTLEKMADESFAVGGMVLVGLCAELVAQGRTELLLAVARDPQNALAMARFIVQHGERQPPELFDEFEHFCEHLVMLTSIRGKGHDA